MKNAIVTACVIGGIVAALGFIPVIITSDKYEIVKLDKVYVNSSDLFTSHGINDPYINDVRPTIIDDCDNVYINENNITIDYGSVYAVKYSRHFDFSGDRYIIEAYKVNESPKDMICQGKPIDEGRFYTNV
jgi:hypothetical protein